MDLLQYPFDGALIMQKKRALRRQLLEKPGLIDKKIAIVSGSTVGDVKNILELFLLHLGIRPTFYEGGYGLFYEDVVFDDGSLAAFGPDLLYIHTSNRNLQNWPQPTDDAAGAAEKEEAAFARFKAVWQAAEKLSCPVVQNNFEMPLWRSFGNMDAWDARGRVAFVRRLNEKMAAYAAAHPSFYVHDLEYLSSVHGVDAWCDTVTWYAYKYMCAVPFIPDLCHSLAALVGSLFGRGKKALITDLDNTLWGGIIGEVGAEGVELGDESPAGMAYAELQQYIKMLGSRGILLGVASKNEEENALGGFARADSPLQREDFLAFEAHWEPKTTSLNRMAQGWNILPESFVFIDDNPAERELVNTEMPAVTTPFIDLPEESVRVLDRGGYFETAALSADDLKRGDMYRQNAERQKVENAFGNYEEYLKSLAMQGDIGPFTPERLERITQLINKTNQFNLTTKRYTDAEVKACMEDGACVDLAGRLVDKFGDNGITSVLIARGAEAGVLDIELWVMSCRVFKRGLEDAMFDALVAEAKKRGVHTIRGRWLRTAKNLLVKDFYATIGFDVLAQSYDEGTYVYTVPETYAPRNKVIAVE